MSIDRPVLDPPFYFYGNAVFRPVKFDKHAVARSRCTAQYRVLFSHDRRLRSQQILGEGVAILMTVMFVPLHRDSLTIFQTPRIRKAVATPTAKLTGAYMKTNGTA